MSVYVLMCTWVGRGYYHLHSYIYIVHDQRELAISSCLRYEQIHRVVHTIIIKAFIYTHVLNIYVVVVLKACEYRVYIYLYKSSDTFILRL